MANTLHIQSEGTNNPPLQTRGHLHHAEPGLPVGSDHVPQAGALAIDPATGLPVASFSCIRIGIARHVKFPSLS